MKRVSLMAALIGAAACIVVVGSAAPALAHAEREIGPYTVAIGLGTEPAYVGYPNSVEVIIHETASGKGVDSAADSLKVTLSLGSASTPIALEPNFDEDSGGSPGDYRGAFIPTSPGAYTIHVTGAIGSTNVDETVTAGPETFATVDDPTTIQFPAKVPTTTELATRVDRATARATAIAAAGTKSAKDAAASARTLGIIGIVVGALGLVVGGVALARRRS
jgi:hypothetical protein